MTDPIDGSAHPDALDSRPVPIISPTRAYPTVGEPPPVPPRRGRIGLLIALAVTLLVIVVALAVAAR